MWLGDGEMHQDGPEPIGGAGAGDDSLVVFSNVHRLLGKGCGTIIIAELAEGDERTGAEIGQDRGCLSRRGESRG